LRSTDTTALLSTVRGWAIVLAIVHVLFVKELSLLIESHLRRSVRVTVHRHGSRAAAQVGLWAKDIVVVVDAVDMTIS